MHGSTQPPDYTLRTSVAAYITDNPVLAVQWAATPRHTQHSAVGNSCRLGARSDRLGGSVLQQRQQQASLPRHCSAECGLVAVKSQPVCVVTDNGCGRFVPISFSRCFTHNCYEPTGFAVLSVVPSVW